MDDSELIGKGAYVSVKVINSVPPNIRGVVHIFQRRNPGDLFSEWVEEYFLHPGIKQRQGLFGSIVSISDTDIVVGVPNRNTHFFTAENQVHFIQQLYIANIKSMNFYVPLLVPYISLRSLFRVLRILILELW